MKKIQSPFPCWLPPKGYTVIISFVGENRTIDATVLAREKTNTNTFHIQVSHQIQERIGHPASTNMIIEVTEDGKGKTWDKTEYVNVEVFLVALQHQI